MSLKDCGLFAQASQAAEETTAFLRLLSSAVDAEPESYKLESYKKGDETRLAAIAILKRHPELLFRKGIVTDHFGRKIWGSPYQLFLGSGDVWALKQVHEEIIPHGDIEVETQFKEQFPHCQWPFDTKMGEEALYDDRNKAQIAQVIAQLKTIAEQITVDPCMNGLATRDETTKAVADLCEIFAPKAGEVIRTGLHFPLAIINEIYKVYNTYYTPWTIPQLSFFSRAVIGAALRALTAVDGQCCKNGLNNLEMEKGPDRQDGLFCRRPQGIPEKLTPISGKLGHMMFVNPYDGESCFLSSKADFFDLYNKNGQMPMERLATLWRGWVSPGRLLRALDNLWRTKAATYRRYYAVTPRDINTVS